MLVAVFCVYMSAYVRYDYEADIGEASMLLLCNCIRMYVHTGSSKALSMPLANMPFSAEPKVSDVYPSRPMTSRTDVLRTYVFVYIYIYIYIYVCMYNVYVCVYCMCAYLCLCVYIYIYIYIYIYKCIYTYAYFSRTW
jgi:hypothetical protein